MISFSEQYYYLTALIFRITKSRLHSMLTLNAFSVGETFVYGIFWIFMAKNQQMFIDTNIHVDKTAK